MLTRRVLNVLLLTVVSHVFAGDIDSSSCKGRCDQCDPRLNCQCDDNCDSYDNCRSDYQSQCSPKLCCAEYGNCCSDYEASCHPTLNCNGRCDNAFNCDDICQCDSNCQAHDDDKSSYKTSSIYHSKMRQLYYCWFLPFYRPSHCECVPLPLAVSGFLTLRVDFVGILLISTSTLVISIYKNVNKL